jgi:hypothetical protein
MDQSSQSGEVTFKPGDFQPVGGEVPIGPSAFQPVDAKAEVPIKPGDFQPELQAKPLPLPTDMSIQAAQPSVWDRVKNVFTSGIPSLSSRTSSNPKYGQAQLLSPEEAMSPAQQERHPILTATGETLGGFTSPESVALIAGTYGLGGLAGAASKAARVLPRLVSGGFALQQVYSAAKQYPEINAAIQAGDTNRAEYLLTKAGLQVGMAGLAATHAATGKPAFGKASATEAEPETAQPTTEPERFIRPPEAPKGAGRGEAPAEMHPEELAAIRTETGRPDLTAQEAHRYRINQLARTAAETRPTNDLGGMVRAGDKPLTETLPLAAQALRDPAPGVRIVDSNAAKAHLESADTISPGAVEQIEPKPTGLTGGTSGTTNLSNEELARRDIFYKVGRNGGLTYLGQQPDATVRAGEGIAALNRDTGAIRSIKGDEDVVEGSRATILNAAKQAGLKFGNNGTARIVSDNHVPVVSQTEVLNEAVQRIVQNSGELKKLGLDPEKIQSRDDVPAMLKSVADKIQANLDPRVGATITFDAQKSLASDLGLDIEDLLARKSGATANAETAIAARALLKDSQTRVMNLARIAAQGDEDYQAKFAESLAQHQAVMESVKGMAAEAGRALGSFRIKEADLPALKISDVFTKLSPDGLAKAAQLLSKIDPNDARQVNNFIEQIKPTSTPDKIFEFYRNALLSSPKTVTVKAGSEIAMMALEATKKVVAGGMSKLTGDSDRFASEAWYYSRGALQAMQHATDVLTGRFNLADAPGFEGGGKQAIKGTVGKIIRFPSTLLERQTNLMYMLNYFGELHAQAARAAIKEGLNGQALHARQEYLAANPSEGMIDAAHQTALHGTFQNELGEFGRSVQRTIQSDPTGISKYLFPFVRTPINLVKASAEFSPYGLIKGLAKGDVDATSRGVIGSGIAAGIAALALEGHITGGGPVDFKKKQTLEATGWQPYSLKIGNKYIAYHRLEPLGLVMGLVADAIHGMKMGDSEQVSSSKADTAVAHIERNLSDLPFMFGLSSIVDALKDTSGKRIDNFIARQVAGFIPAGVANIAESLDPTVRHPQGVAQTIQSRIPGLTRNVPPSIDITGQPIQRPASQLGGANPFPITTQRNNPAITEMARLGLSVENTPQKITQPKTGLGLKRGERAPSTVVNPDEARTLQMQDSQLLTGFLSALVPTDDWRGMTDEQKRAVIKHARSEITGTRWERLFRIRVGNATTSIQQTPIGNPTGNLPSP